jgi:large subunit ribosomal protein L17
LAKNGGISNRRIAHSRIMDETQERKLFDVIGPRYADRNGGYTRVVKAGIRMSDSASIAIIEFVDRDPAAKGQDSGPVMTEELEEV